MHFRSLLTVYLPEVQPDPEWEKDISATLEELRELPPGKIVERVLHRINMENLNCISNAFGRELTPVVREVMERFYYETEDRRYLEFEDRTAEYLAEYHKQVTCIRLPDGRIVEEDSMPVWNKFIVKDGLVYQKEAGPLHQPKRTKKAKKMKALLNVPRKVIYKTFENYIDQECYASFNEETGKYGEWYNPDGIYDWYSIGGRWSDMFLIKSDCTDYSLGEKDYFSYEESSAPEGYMWVACARKRDIQWDLMRDWRNKKATERFYQLEAMFRSGETSEKYYMVTEEAVLICGEPVYVKGQTLEEFLEKYGIPDSWKYPISVHDIFHDETYLDQYSCTYESDDGTEEHFNWRRTIDEFIDDADEDEVFVSIDYHS